MANNFSSSPEDRLLWQQRAPRASYWFHISDSHPDINGGQPIPEFGPPPPYTPPHPPGPPAPSMQAHFSNTQVVPSLPGGIHSEATIGFLPASQVPVYDLLQGIPAPLFPHMIQNLTSSMGLKNNISIGFTVSVPSKPLGRQDTLSRAEITFEWNVLFHDFYDCICARMDTNMDDAMLGYKFDSDPKKSIIRLPSNNSTAFDTMLEKVKSRITRARTHAVVLEIHNLVSSTMLPPHMSAARQKKTVEATKLSAATEQTIEFWLLLEKLRKCQENHCPWCWVVPGGIHKTMTVFQVTLWAKMIASGIATLDQPPSTSAFNHLWTQVQKGKKAPSLPKIHIHLPDHLNIGATSSRVAETIHKEVSDAEQTTPSPATFKAKFQHSDWKF
ncbi:hypothetical protein BJ322DRAFT_1023023 [Thelephora terrestris]|uniref:Uncharacterized protein n=1 Tax=Thelephora terrestris TaxID=56493 RepID=A0A9P6H8A1_9AGAM|nr:hypothetical protein BJ322DRAFT_1023023 [Thelephora terrestris]